MTGRNSTRSALLLIANAALLTGCAVGPNYRRPSALEFQPMPAAFSAGVGADATNGAEWKVAQPSAGQPRGAWWKIFNDAELDRLETLAASENQNLTAAAARFAQARALVNVARADFFPQLSAQPSFTRQRTSVNQTFLGQPLGRSATYNTFLAPLDLSWEADLWGRVRRQTEAARAQLSASADDLESAKLAVASEVAADYFTLRAVTAERQLVADTATAYRRSLQLTINRRNGGIASDLDVAQAQTQLRTTEAQLPALDLQRANLLHALAALCGRAAIGFEIAPAAVPASGIPPVPVSVPSEWLERRPDIAAAERRMAAANAGVGVAKSAFYPRIVFNGLAGFQSFDAGTLFDWPSRLWAIGPSVNLPIFTGGRNRAQLAAAYAAYDETVANYRQTVLAAFQQVEDQLAAQRLLTAELKADAAAYRSASRTLEIATNRYKAGLVSYLEVATAQTTALNQERAVVRLRGERRVTEVALIQALGGGWENSEPVSARR